MIWDLRLRFQHLNTCLLIVIRILKMYFQPVSICHQSDKIPLHLFQHPLIFLVVKASFQLFHQQITYQQIDKQPLHFPQQWAPFLPQPEAKVCLMEFLHHLQTSTYRVIASLGLGRALQPLENPLQDQFHLWRNQSQKRHQPSTFHQISLATLKIWVMIIMLSKSRWAFY